jgi:outer membrane immunogenic protein
MLRQIVFYLFFVQIFFINTVFSQRFGGGLKLAATFSQIDGDDVYGFNKFGYEAGIYGSASLSKIMDLEIHFSYNQRGSRSTSDDISTVKIDLNYLDVPVLLVIKDWLNEDGEKDYYRVNVFGGFSLGRLISSSSNTRIDEDFSKTDFSWILGASYFFTPGWGVSAKYTRSFTSLLDRNVNGAQIKMISYFISLGLNYKFK